MPEHGNISIRIPFLSDGRNAAVGLDDSVGTIGSFAALTRAILKTVRSWELLGTNQGEVTACQILVLRYIGHLQPVDLHFLTEKGMLKCPAIF